MFFACGGLRLYCATNIGAFEYTITLPFDRTGSEKLRFSGDRFWYNLVLRFNNKRPNTKIEFGLP
jgi:hypothetical protein